MNQNSGGWRYGNGGSNQFLYRNEEVDNELLKRAAGVTAPKGLLDTKIEAAPVDKYLQQDSDNRSGGDYNGNQSATSKSTGLASEGWGSNKYGVDIGFNVGNAAKGFGLLGPIGALAGLQPTKDPLGQFAYNALVAQEKRDAAQAAKDMQSYANIDRDTPAGYGWSSLSPDVQSSIAAADDPIGAFANSIGMGDSGGWSPSYGDNSTADSPGGSDMGGYGGADNGYYKGGMVTPKRLAGENPKGPDDGYAALDHGEYVIRASAVKKYGKGLLDAINTEKFKG